MVLKPWELEKPFPAAFGDTVPDNYVYPRVAHLWCAFHDGGKGAYVAVVPDAHSCGFGTSGEAILAAAAVAPHIRRCYTCTFAHQGIYSCAQPTLVQCQDHVVVLPVGKRLLLQQVGGDGGAAANAEYAKKVGAPLDLAKQQLSKAGSRLLCMDKYVGVSDVKANDRELKSWRSRVKAAATGKQMAKVALEWLEWTAGSHHIQGVDVLMPPGSPSGEAVRAKAAADLRKLAAATLPSISAVCTHVGTVWTSIYRPLQHQYPAWGMQKSQSSVRRSWQATVESKRSAFGKVMPERGEDWKARKLQAHTSSLSAAQELSHRYWGSHINLSPRPGLGRAQLLELREEGVASVTERQPVVLQVEAASGRPCLLAYQTDEFYVPSHLTPCVLLAQAFCQGASFASLGASGDELVANTPLDRGLMAGDIAALFARQGTSGAMGAFVWRHTAFRWWELIRERKGIYRFSSLLWSGGQFHAHSSAFIADQGLLCVGPAVVLVETNDRVHLDAFAARMEEEHGLLLPAQIDCRMLAFDPRHPHASMLPYAGALPVAPNLSKSQKRRASEAVKGTTRKRHRSGAKHLRLPPVSQGSS